MQRYTVSEWWQFGLDSPLSFSLRWDVRKEIILTFHLLPQSPRFMYMCTVWICAACALCSFIFSIFFLPRQLVALGYCQLFCAHWLCPLSSCNYMLTSWCWDQDSMTIWAEPCSAVKRASDIVHLNLQGLWLSQQMFSSGVSLIKNHMMAAEKKE